MQSAIQRLLSDETGRNDQFPVTRDQIFMAHAGVTALPRPAGDALTYFAKRATGHRQEDAEIWKLVGDARNSAASLLGCSSGEIALLGPTSLGLNLVANGLAWRPGDEVVYYPDDYPANVYPWLKLKDSGVRPIELNPEIPGRITWELIEPLLTNNTRLVSLASCNYLAGYRIDVDGIGRHLRERGILFCVDGIQSIGAFPFSVDNVDFMSADSHKWMLGPVGAGLFYVKESRFDELNPTLLGAWNVVSPDFVPGREIEFYPGARRYEPGSLNIPGILAMRASLKMLLEYGISSMADRILSIRRKVITGLTENGYRIYGAMDSVDEKHASGIITFHHPVKDIPPLADLLEKNGIAVSCRKDRSGLNMIRLSPHFYNTDDEVERVIDIIADYG